MSNSGDLPVSSKTKPVICFKNLQKHSDLMHQENRQGARISTAYKKSSCKQLHDAQRAYLNSFAAKYRAGLQTTMGNRKKVTSKDKLRAFQLAEILSVWKPCDEQVILHPKMKLNNLDFRFILSFGEENQARQILIRNLLLHRFDTCAEQFMFGGGRDNAVKSAIEHYQKGYKYVLEVDVTKAFRSFDVLGISKFLKLPEKVCLHVLSGVSLNIDLSKDYSESVIVHDPAKSNGLTPIQEFSGMDSDWVLARQGLTEGSKVSPFVAELLFAWVIDRLPHGKGQLINYADNFLFLSKSEHEAKELRLELQKLLDEHPAGPLTVNPSHLIPPGKGFHFLGYFLDTSKNCLTVYSNDKFLKTQKTQRKRVYDLLGGDASITKKAKAVNALYEKQMAGVSGFSLWRNGRQQVRRKLSKVVKRAREKNVPDELFSKRIKEEYL